MPYGKIVSVHGRNVSVSVQTDEDQGRIIDGNEVNRLHLDITLPAYNLRDVDYAVANIGDAVKFGSVMGHIWFPSAYESNVIEPGKDPEPTQ